jgi:hypothetical protein
MGQRSLLFNSTVYYYWMFIGSFQSVIIYFSITEIYKNAVMNEKGQPPDHWILGMAMFTSLIFVVTTKFVCISRLFIWPMFCSFFFGTYVMYITYIWYTDDMKDLVKHHYSFFKITTSPWFHFSWILPTGICLYFDYFIEAA